MHAHIPFVHSFYPFFFSFVGFFSPSILSICASILSHFLVTWPSISQHLQLNKGKRNSQSDYWQKKGIDSTSNISIVTSQREDVPFPPRLNSRRNSRMGVTKQHSYDDDIKGSMQRTDSQNDTDLNVPIIPRRWVAQT